MPFIQCDFHSDTLGMACSMNVLLPQPAAATQIGMTSAAANTGDENFVGYKTLYLLHGLSDDHTIWMRRTSIERYAAPLGLAVVMPAVHRSYYADMDHGLRYWTFISQELPRVCRAMFRLSPRREDTFAAGLSMGGYGAFKLALNHPDRFAAAASLSGAVDPEALVLELLPDRQQEWNSIFGDPMRIRGTDNDLFHLAEQLSRSRHADLPLFQCCGGDDFLLEHNHRFRDHAKKLGLNLAYHEHPGFGHAWEYWDKTIQDVLKWLPLS